MLSVNSTPQVLHKWHQCWKKALITSFFKSNLILSWFLFLSNTVTRWGIPLLIILSVFAVSCKWCMRSRFWWDWRLPSSDSAAPRDMSTGMRSRLSLWPIWLYTVTCTSSWRKPFQTWFRERRIKSRLGESQILRNQFRTYNFKFIKRIEASIKSNLLVDNLTITSQFLNWSVRKFRLTFEIVNYRVLINCLWNAVKQEDFQNLACKNVPFKNTPKMRYSI